MPYLFLAGAILLELVGTTCLKYSEGFSKLVPSLVTIVSYIACFILLSKTLNYLDLGITYATWCGVGIVVTAVISAVLFKQGLSLWGVIGIILIVLGCVLLNVWGKAS